MLLHADETPVDEALVRAMLAEQRPEWGRLPLAPVGAGTDNVMFRLGGDLLVRVPRRPERGGGALAKERRWLPLLGSRLTLRVPEAVHGGTATAGYAGDWAVLRWIEGQDAGPGSVRDWAAFGADLAAFVGELHAVELSGAVRAGALAGYRGGSLVPHDAGVREHLLQCRSSGLLAEAETDALAAVWAAGRALPDPPGPHRWLHTDLRPGNLLVRDGRLHAVIDWGALQVGLPDVEHAVLWDYPPQARRAYRDALGVGDAAWARARAWAVMIGAAGLPYYRETLPVFAAECRARLRAVLADS